jgi:hypothetical protein
MERSLKPIYAGYLYVLAKGKGQRAKGKGQRAEGKRQRAKGRGLRVAIHGTLLSMSYELRTTSISQHPKE